MERPIILQIKDIYYNFLVVFGVLANLLTILILSRGNCGLSKCISVYMVAMATADLLVIIFHIMVFQIFCYHFPHSFLSYTAVCKSIPYINTVTLDMSVWFTVFFTFDRFVTICCQKFKTKYCTERTAATVLTTVTVLACIENMPFPFSYESQRIINNVSWGCRANVAFYSSPAGIAYFRIQSILVPWFAVALILLFNCLTVRRIVVSSRARRRLRGHCSEIQSDPEMESRRKSIILLFTVSGSFILLWLTSAMSFFNDSLAVYYKGEFENPDYILAESGYMLMYLSSCTNTCIYAATQTKFRQELVKMVKSPWKLILILVIKMKN